MKERGPNKAVEETPKGGLEPASPEQTAADLPLDVGQFGPALEELLENYRSALRSIEKLRPVQRVAVEILRIRSRQSPNVQAEPWRRRRRLVIRWLVRLFAEAHVRRQLGHVTRVLRLEAFGASKGDERATAINELLERLQNAEAQLSGWGRLRSGLFKAPLVTTALAFALAVYRVGSGIDVSSASKLGETLAQSAETTGWDNVLHLLLRAFYTAVFTYVLLVPLTVSLGFKRKRAIFSGGLTDESRPMLYWLRDRQGVWPWSPKANVYQRENDVFELLAVPKRREAPLNLLLSIFPYYFVFAMVLVTMEGFRKSWWDGALTLLVGSLAVFSMLQPRLTIWTRRSTAGNV